MSWSRSAAVIRHEMRLYLADATSLSSLVVMPLIMIAFLRPLARLALTDRHPGANGSEFTVPAMATMFAFFLVSFIGFSFLNDRTLRTWDRLRASPASNADLMVGKIVPAFVLAFGQQVFIFGMGALLFGLRVRGSVIGLGLVVVVLCLSLTAFGVLLAAVFRTNQQLNAFANLSTFLLAGISGALVPLEVLPAWARAVAPVSPQYWALRAYRSMILEGEGIGAVALPCAVLIGVGVIAAALAMWRFSFDEGTVQKVKESALAPAV